MTIPLTTRDPELQLAVVEAKTGREAALYLLPLIIRWARLDRVRNDTNALAAVRRGRSEGTLLDAATDQSFIAFMLEEMRNGRSIEADGGRLAFEPTRAFAAATPHPIESVRAISTEQSNTTVLIGNKYVLKLFRRLEPGTNPEVEIGRFLTEAVSFPHAPALRASAELEREEKTSAVAVLHEFVENQGDAWTVTAHSLDRYVEEQRLLTAEAAGQSDEQTAYLGRMQLVGVRVAQLQLALASRDDIAEFAPEPLQADDVAHWREDALKSANAVLDTLLARRRELPESALGLLDDVMARRESLPNLLRDLFPDSLQLSKIRHHGDFHLGQILIVKDDISIIDFEGEPRRAIEERRRKGPAARDVAGLIRSIDYSATAALRRALNSAPDPQDRIARALDRWRDSAVGAFLGSYRQTLTDARLWPASHDDADRLLDFFLLQKVFYEIGYELAHRPDCVWVPLAGARRILHAERAAR